MSASTQGKTKKVRRGRPALHGGYSLLTRGELPERRRWLRGYLSEVRQGLVRDLGPTERDLTSAQGVLIDRAITKLGILRVIEEHVRETGVFKKGQLDPALGTHYLAYSNSLRLELQALGINQRKASEVLDLGRYKETKIKEKAARTSGSGPACEPPEPGAGPTEEPAAPGRGEAGEAGQEIALPGSTSRDFPGKADQREEPPS